MTQDITMTEILTANNVIKMTDRTRLWASSRAPSPLVRLSVALNEHTDWDDLEHLVNDTDPMVAGVAKAQLDDLKKVERIFLYMIESKERILNPDALMDGKGNAVVRHYTGRNVEGLTTSECISKMKEKQWQDRKSSKV